MLAGVESAFTATQRPKLVALHLRQEERESLRELNLFSNELGICICKICRCDIGISGVRKADGFLKVK